MELKVWVEGIQRIVCGVTVTTTCQDVVFALAHATGKVGRFTLIERWRNNERLLAPHENPLKLLLKWGEYANDVQFILQRSESKQQQQQQQQQQPQQQPSSVAQQTPQQQPTQIQQQHRIEATNTNTNTSNNDSKNAQTNAVMLKKPLGLSNTNNTNNNNNNNNNYSNINNNNNSNYCSNSNSNSSSNSIDCTYNVQQQQQQQQSRQHMLQDKTKELKKSFGAYDYKQTENIGIVKGIQQRPVHTTSTNSPTLQQQQQQQQQQQLHQLHQQQHQQPLINVTATRAHVTPALIPKHEKSHSNPIDLLSTSNSNSNNNNNNHIYAAIHNEHAQPFNSNNNNNIVFKQLGAQHSKSINEINLAVVRDSLDRRTTTNAIGIGESPDILYATPHSHHMNNTNNNNSNSSNNNNNNNNNQNSISSNNSSNNSHSSETLLDVYNVNATKVFNASPDPYKNATTGISANGALVPPPYRDPPPPRNSPLQTTQPQQQQQQQQQQRLPVEVAAHVFVANEYGSNEYEFEFRNGPSLSSRTLDGSPAALNSAEESESIFQATQYNDLLQLIKFQREKISAQQLELSKYDAEIVFLENKERDQAQELDAISREITKADQIFRQGSEQLQILQYVEEENELVKQQEKTLKSEIALLRSKLANCETELLQCKNKIRLLMDDIELEQRSISNKQKSNRQNVERDFLMEMERIQNEIDQAIHNTDTSNKTAENLKKEILLIENAIAEKKRQVEQLVNEMKEVNLQSLTVTTSEEIKHLLEGPNKPGSSRRIIGSPRQLENAVPTSKNPHGVWV